MFSALVRYFEDKITLTAEELALIERHCIFRSLKKKTCLLQEGEICRHTTFVVKGCLRSYRTDNAGNEHTFKFVIENWWINDGVSYNNGTPAQFNIQAVEDSELILIAKKDFDNLLEEIPVLKQITEKLTSNSFIASQQRLYNQISLSPEERYQLFIDTYPDIFNRVPLHMLASYLGMSRETLTRIRAHYAKKGI
jgi:CRP-like cAMP-binding protein